MFTSIYFIIVISTSIFGVYQTDFALPLDQVEEISEYSYEKCLLMRKIFYEGQCWELLSKGPCDKNQWLVLEWSNDDREQQEPMKARCAKRRCNESDVYWPQDGFCYNAETARHRRLCPGADTELAADEFGDGHCKCRNGDRVPYVRVAPADRNYYYGDEDSKPCYPLYAKGPCPRGQVLIPVGLGYGDCTVDPCGKERSHGLQLNDRTTAKSPAHRLRWRRQLQLVPRVTVVPWTDGRCYELGTQGPCASNEKLTVLLSAMRPGCIKPATVLDLFSNKKSTSPPPCKTDHRGECVDGVDVQIDDPSFGFEAQLRESAKRRAERNKRKNSKTP